LLAIYLEKQRFYRNNAPAGRKIWQKTATFSANAACLSATQVQLLGSELGLLYASGQITTGDYISHLKPQVVP
jgi:hypothetical protein